MKVTVKELRSLIHEAASEIAMSSEYVAKERVREHLQEMIANAVKTGAIKNQADLSDFFATLEMAASALKMVPFDVFKTMV